MGGIQLHPISWIGSGLGTSALSVIDNGDTSLAGGAAFFGNGFGDPFVTAWNHIYLGQPTLPGGVLPVALQTTWYLAGTDPGQSTHETVVFQCLPEPYNAGEIRVDVPLPSAPTAYGVNFNAWNPAWPLNSLRVSFLANGLVSASELIAFLYYAEPPSAHFTSPTTNGAIVNDTVRPTLQWSYAAGDFGGPQTAYRLRVYTQAQTQATGFVPGVTQPIWDSLEVRTSVLSATVPINLTNNTQYVAYLAVAQTVNGFDQWATGYATRSFSISIPAASVPARPAVVATADSTNARIALTVTQSGSPTWDHVIVERSVDDGDTWTTVRGGDVDIAAGDTLAIWDYETGNGVQAVYRAQAQRTTTTAGITQVTVSQYSPSTAAVAWTSTSVWLKAPLFPAFNMTVRLGQFGTFTRRMARGVFDVVGRSTPVVVSDVRHGLEGQMTVAVRSVDELNSIRFMSDLGTTVLLQAPPSFNFGSHYLALGDEHEDRINIVASNAYRWVQFDFVEVDAPAGELIDTSTAPPVVTPPPVVTGYILDEAGNILTDEAGNRLTGF